MIHDTHNPSNFEMVVRITEIVIWPVTALIIVLLFRRKIMGVIHRVGSFKASTSGVEMTFAPQLDAAKKLFSKLRPNAVSKSTPALENSTSYSGSPYEQLKQIESELQQTVVELAQEAGISPTGKSNLQLCNALEKSGVVNNENSKLMQALFHVIHKADKSVSQNQVNEIISLYKAL